MITVYGLNGCDSCRKARRWLDAQRVAHEFVDLRAAPPAPATWSHWLDAVGAAQLINRRSTTWRQLDDSARDAAQDDPAALLMRHPALAKRPVLDTGDAVTVGFDADEWRALVG